MDQNLQHKLHWYRVVGMTSFLLALGGLLLAGALVIFAQESRATIPVFWSAVALMIACFFLILPFSVWRMKRLLGVSSSRHKQSLVRALFGGPLGAMLDLWELTDQREARRR